ncbi:putative Glucan endo-1,6-beta-glucosidase [Verrucomicrobia bacterium]|nr:putative Glucan endo-1,6-beta-glucosidase [Verrucomicrobiota bacterium]
MPKRLITLLITFALLGWLAGVEWADGQTVNVWLTTHDQSALLQEQSPLVFSNGTGGTNCVVVDETQLYQPVEGFGAAFTDTTGYILNEVAGPLVRSNAMLKLFTRNSGGIGLSFMRLPMGASDLARFEYSYDDLPAGQTDTNLDFFSIAHDETDIIPLILQARQLNPQLRIMANPWSPPGWMKSSGSMVGGSLLASMYVPFANYFVKFIQAYQAQGIVIDYIGLQNEPLYVPSDYPGMSMDAPTQTTLLRDYVLPALAANHLTKQVLVYDHNWDRPDYPETAFSDATLLGSAQVAGTAWHGYGGTPGAMLTLAGDYPLKNNYETEHSGGTWVSDQLVTDFEEIIHVMRCGARSFVKWNLASDQNDGPHSGGCGSCTPLVMINTSSGAAGYPIDFYTLGQFSKFVLPGAYRVYSANSAGMITAAFLNPDGSKVLVAFNDTTNANTLQAQWGARVFSSMLPSYAAATFTWSGTQSGSYTLSATNQIRASSFNSVSGLETEQTTDALGGYDLGYASSSSYAVYRNVSFPQGLGSVSARVASGGTGGSLLFRLDSPTGALAGSVSLPITGGFQTWQTVTGFASGANGLHDVYADFEGRNNIGNLNWFQFGGPVQPPPCYPWATVDVGAVGLTGGATWSNGTFAVSGSGADIWNTADALQFVNQPTTGACEIRARVVSLQGTDPWAKAGVMLRESLAAGAVNASVLVSASNGAAFQIRGSTGGATVSTVVGGVAVPCWVRLARTAGDLFAGYFSSDGSNWTQIRTSTSIPMTNAAPAGLAVTAHNNGLSCMAVLDNVSVNQPPALAPIANQTILAGRVLVVTNSASDPDVPAQTLAFGLTSPPAGALVNPTSGLFTWRPAIAQSPSTQAVAVVVSDDGVPSMSATQRFLVTVTRPANPVLNATPDTNGRFGFWINGNTGPDYTIQGSTNLEAWSSLVSTNSTSLPWFWTDPSSSGFPWRFYRAVLGP